MVEEGVKHVEKIIWGTRTYSMGTTVVADVVSGTNTTIAQVPRDQGMNTHITRNQGINTHNRLNQGINRHNLLSH